MTEALYDQEETEDDLQQIAAERYKTPRPTLLGALRERYPLRDVKLAEALRALKAMVNAPPVGWSRRNEGSLTRQGRMRDYVEDLLRRY